MKILVVTLITLTCLSSFAKKTKNHYKDISQHTHDKAKPVLTQKDLRERLTIQAEVYVTSSDGSQLIHDRQESRVWSLNGKNKFESVWISNSDVFGKFAIKQNWKLNEDNQLIATIEQFEVKKATTKDGTPTLGKIIKDYTFYIRNFSPVDLTLNEFNNKRTIVVLTPVLHKKDKPYSINNFQLKAKKAIIADSKGKVWAQDLTFSGKYVSLKTHEGTLALSFFPFNGAKEVGVAEDGHISLSIGQKYRVNIVSSLPFTPTGNKITVYGAVNFKKRSKKIRSVHIQSSSDEKNFKF